LLGPQPAAYGISTGSRKKRPFKFLFCGLRFHIMAI
jgi:hypothetical protein